MVYIVCSVRDLKSEVFGAMHIFKSVGEAIRSFDDTVNQADENNIMFKHPEDFHFFQLGTYDDAKGQMVSVLPKLLISGDQVKRGQIHKEVQKISKV